MYLYFKALHVFAIAVFIGGLLLVALAHRYLRKNSTGPELTPVVAAIMRWDSYVTSPALGLVWIAGIAMAFGGGWETAPWFLLKLPFVLFLSALHGMIGARLRKAISIDGSSRLSSGIAGLSPVWILVSFAVVAFLAVAKPF